MDPHTVPVLFGQNLVLKNVGEYVQYYSVVWWFTCLQMGWVC